MTGFPSAFKGPHYRPGDADYENVKQIWNMRRGDHRPALIVQPLDTGDVVEAVKHANRNDLPIAVRSGGHGIDCAAMPHDALVVDLSRLKGISIDPGTGLTTVDAGVRLGEMDAATQQHGYVVPAGVVTDTGVAGLTLGGGIGHLTRRFGATVDNLRSVDVVTTDGRTLTASADSHPDLFWGLRGAGHNLAIATSFTFQAHRAGPEVMSGLLVYSADDAVPLVSGLDEVMARAPRTLSVALLALSAPPLPGLPPETIGTPVLVALIVYTGPLDEYETAMSGFRALATPLTDLVRPTTWLEANSIVDPFEPPGRRNHLLGGYFPELNAEIARIALARIAAAPASEGGLPSSLITLPILGGALFDHDENSTAFSRTGAAWLYEVSAHWDAPSADGKYSSWVESTMAAFAPYATKNCYVNLTADRGPDWLRGAYGSAAKWDRLVALKQTWDPENLLRYNKNIPSSGE
ncbi:FAD-binding oxidoreductase [Amycolatopsis jejuensis]|uniref:FAD-binding oxidoreductase n=1 Tax=Amycolatopsis jejuensis TaxID=330084 RepID=UPI000526FF30|nr:FAD-dependent oxidoreductase [Amycolatopsis jejuensis]